MSEGAVADRYARALLDLGRETGELESLAASMREFSEAAVSHRELRAVLFDPTVAKEQRASVIRAVGKRLSMPEMGIRGLLLMSRRRRLGVLSAVSRRLTELADEVTGVLRGTVTTAQPMPENFYESLSESISRATGRKIILSRQADERLIGGAVARVGDATVDASVRGQLDDIERELTLALGSES